MIVSKTSILLQTFFLLVVSASLSAAFPVYGRILCLRRGVKSPQPDAMVVLRDGKGYNLGYTTNVETDKFGKFHFDATSFETTNQLQLEVYHSFCGDVRFFEKKFTGPQKSHDFGDLVLEAYP